MQLSRNDNNKIHKTCYLIRQCSTVYLCRNVMVRVSQLGGHGLVDAADTQNIQHQYWCNLAIHILSLDNSLLFILWSTKCLDTSPFCLIPLLMTLLTLNEDWDVTADDDLQTQCVWFMIANVSASGYVATALVIVSCVIVKHDNHHDKYLVNMQLFSLTMSKMSKWCLKSSEADISMCIQLTKDMPIVANRRGENQGCVCAHLHNG